MPIPDDYEIGALIEKAEMVDIEYFDARHPDRTYISKQLKSFSDPTRMVRIINKVIDSGEGYEHLKLNNEIILRTTPSGRQQITAKLYEDTRGIFVLTLQRYTAKNGNPHELSFSFVGNEIKTLKNFIDSLPFLDFSTTVTSRTEDEEVEKRRQLLMNTPNLDLVIELAEKNITKRDVVALAYRKEQLGIFKNLLENESFFEDKKQEWKKSKSEYVWQYFFENNPWIFGYGLNLVFNEPLEGQKLEKIVKGSDVASGGKRIDGLLKSRGVINSLCLAEIKTHKTPLLKQVLDSYRIDCWRMSDELSGGVAQIQKTAQKTIENIGVCLKPQKENGDPTGENIYLYKPRTYLIIGKLSEFESEHGLNEEKYSSFELFRRNLTEPEIITFDELYERAKFIVHNNQELSEQDNQNIEF
jgi:hypothetical protein